MRSSLRRAAAGGLSLRRGGVTALFVVLIAANGLAWLWAWALFAHAPALFGAAILAYTFGVRHAVDADHIAAIDNVVRKFMQEGRRPHAVGFYFSLGHSSVVILAVLVIALAAQSLTQEFSSFKAWGGTIGTAVSAFFLLAIGAANLLILKSTWRTFHQIRRGDGAGDADAFAATVFGPLTRLFGPAFRAISKPWHMYPLGFLFGLGFDTATEISLLSVSATHALDGLSLWSILVFPALFASGMALVDTADSAMMAGAYGWAFINPLRKLWYNLTITAASVAIAVFIGGVEAAGLIADKLGLEGGIWGAVATLNDGLANTGFIVIGLFAASWVLSAAIYRWSGYDRPALSPAPAPDPEFQHSLCS